MGVNARALPASVRRRVVPALDDRPKPKRRPAQNGVLARAGVGSELELLLLNRLMLARLPEPERQFQFCPTRQWRSDFAYPVARLLIECDGGAYIQGRHTRGKGFEEDCVKLSTAAALGYRVIRVTRTHIQSGQAVELIRLALGVNR